MRYREFITESWSKKYKKSINCSNPKGFSQRAHCAGRKARSAGKKTKSSSVSEMQLHEEYSWVIQHKDTEQVIGMFKDQDAAIDQYNSIRPAKRRNYVVKNVPRRHIDPRDL